MTNDTTASTLRFHPVLTAGLHAFAQSRGQVRLHSRSFSGVDLHELLRLLARLAERYDVVFQIVDPNGAKLAVFSSGSILLFAAMGFYVGGVPGALAGAGVGLIVGYSAAHMTLCWEGATNTLQVI